jgi:hypothetical protein
LTNHERETTYSDFVNKDIETSPFIDNGAFFVLGL